MGNLKEMLQEILSLRKNGLEDLLKIKEEIQKFSVIFNSVDALKEDKNWSSFINKTEEKKANWEKFIELCDKTQHQVNQLYDFKKNVGTLQTAINRSSREYVNIGIIAPFRHGKSTLLRKVIEWDKNDIKFLIPTDDSPSAPCTAAKVDYINSSYKISGEEFQDYAVITFYTEEEVKQTIISLINKFNNEKSQSLTLEYDEKANLSDLIDNLSNHLKGHKFAPNSIGETLSHYVDGYPQYKDSFSSNSTDLQLSGEEDLKGLYQYICFYKSPDKKNPEDRQYKALATKHVDIYKHFKINGIDPGPIRFLDTPGLGEQRLTVEESLSKTLREDIDIAIAMQKTGKDNNGTMYQNFIGFLREDFNIIVHSEDLKCGLKDCLYYLFNIDCEDGSIIYQEYDDIKRTLESDGEHKVVLGKDHFKFIDCNEDQIYTPNFTTKVQPDGETKNVIELKSSENKGCSKFLDGVLNDLKDVIKELDKYFSSSVFTDYEKVLYSLKEMKSLKNNFIYSIKKAEERNYKLGKIVEGIKDPQYKNCDSEAKFNDFIKKDADGIVNDFMTGKEVLTEDAYKDLLEMEVYSQLKNSLKKFIIEQFKNCFSISDIESAATDAKTEIGKAFKTELGDIFICTEEKWTEEFVRNYKEECPELCNCLERINRVSIANDNISDYVKIKLATCFHSERHHDDYMFESYDKAKETIKGWLIDIVTDIIKKSAEGETGKQSFDQLIQESKEAYRKEYANLRFELKKGTCRNELEDFMDGPTERQNIIYTSLRSKEATKKKWDSIINILDQNEVHK